jgi:peptidoglycan hydrolase CwlO-like protein
MANNKDVILQELRTLNDAICEARKDISDLRQNQERNEKMITQLLQIVGATNAKVGSFDEKMIMVKESSTELKSSMEAITRKMKQQDEMMELLAKRSIQHESDIVELKKMKSA